MVVARYRLEQLMLLPDEGRRYPPSLAGWEKKITYLLREGYYGMADSYFCAVALGSSPLI